MLNNPLMDVGEPFDNRVSVGVMYMIKLHHMVDDNSCSFSRALTHLLPSNLLVVKHSLVDNVSVRWSLGPRSMVHISFKES